MSNRSGLVLVLLTVAASVQADDVVRSFVADARAYRPGDALTVLIVESAAATSRASTELSKDESISASARRPSGEVRAIGAGWDVDFGGAGQVERSGRLLGRVTVQVVAVDSVGQLVVHGEQDIQVNRETQRIRLDGTVRPADIAADNTVPSWRVQNGAIVFTGDGVLGRTQRPGPIARVLTWLGIN